LVELETKIKLYKYLTRYIQSGIVVLKKLNSETAAIGLRSLREDNMAMNNKLKTGEASPDLQVVNAGGETINLASIWADRPVILTFLRHFG
jgi:hypothetical protein